jgi:voltage-gated potassium channel Kch
MYDPGNNIVYKTLVIAVILVIGIGTVFYHYFERFPWVDAYYFCVVTLATVGYGDYVPTTQIGKIFTTFYIFVGVGIITTFISYTLRRQAVLRARRQDDSSKEVESD